MSFKPGTYQIFEVIKQSEDGNYESTNFYNRTQAETYAQSLIPKRPYQVKNHFEIRVNYWLKLGNYRAQLQDVTYWDSSKEFHRLANKLFWVLDFQTKNWGKYYVRHKDNRLEWRLRPA